MQCVMNLLTKTLFCSDVIRCLSYGSHHVIMLGNVSVLSENEGWDIVAEALRSTDGIKSIFHLR